jgi:signal peptidase II
MGGGIIELFRGRKQRIALALAIFSGNFLLDRLTKIIAAALFEGHPPVVLLRGLLVFAYVENSGAFLSLGAGWNILVKYCVLLVIPVLICVLVLIYMMLREQKMRRIVAASSIIGGGVGNIIDRMFNSFNVIDFMNFGIGNFRTGILNTADLSVTFGVIVLLSYEIQSHWKESRENKGQGRRIPQ